MDIFPPLGLQSVIQECKSETGGIKPLKILFYKTARVSFFQSHVRQLGSLTKIVAIPTIVYCLRPT